MFAIQHENGHTGKGSEFAFRAQNDPVVKKLIEIFPEIAKSEGVLKALLQDRKAAETPKEAKAAAFPFSARAWARLKALILLILLLYTIPVALVLVAVNMAWDMLHLVQQGNYKHIQKRLPAVLGWRTKHVRGTAIVSGAKSTKGLHVCRHLHRAGWRVVLVDVERNWASGARWSACVAAFRTYPDPNIDPIGYLEAIGRIAAEERAKLFVPVSIAQFSVYEALAADLLSRNLGTRACTVNAVLTAGLNDKSSFSELCEGLGILVPKSFPITTKERLYELNNKSSLSELCEGLGILVPNSFPITAKERLYDLINKPEEFGGKTFLLKSIAYNATARADMFTLPCSNKELAAYVAGLDISEEQPWMLQQLLRGEEYSSYSIASEGRLVLHSDTRARASNLRYLHTDNQQIWEWVKAFCEKTNATGQLCFDFMHNDEDGRMYAFECNPRTSTIFLNFYNHDHAVQAFFNAQAVCEYGKAPYKPHSSAREVVWIWNEVGELLFGRLPACRSLSEAGHALTETAWLLLSSVDAVLDPADPLPFLGLHYMQVVALLLRNIKLGNPWVKVDLCTGKLVEVGGD